MSPLHYTKTKDHEHTEILLRETIPVNEKTLHGITSSYLMSLPDYLPPDLADEITSLNSIYSADTLTLPAQTSLPSISLILTLPQTPLSLLLLISANYPAEAPWIERVTHIDESLPKGTGIRVLALAREIITELTSTNPSASTVVLYELVETLESRIVEDVVSTDSTTQLSSLESRSAPPEITQDEEPGPAWIFSDPLISHKSTFLARACAVETPAQAHAALRHLLATDKRAAKATHNMWAYRIRTAKTQIDSSAAEIVYADADDDGEDGAGAKLAALLQSMGANGVFVVVSRWYGGIKLGPERWRLIGNAAREALVRGVEVEAWKVDKM